MCYVPLISTNVCLEGKGSLLKTKDQMYMHEGCKNMIQCGRKMRLTLNVQLTKAVAHYANCTWDHLLNALNMGHKLKSKSLCKLVENHRAVKKLRIKEKMQVQ